MTKLPPLLRHENNDRIDDKSMDSNKYDQWIQQLTQHLVEPTSHCWQTIQNLMRGNKHRQGLTWKHCQGVGGVKSCVYILFPGRRTQTW
jgi:hypothetical protein